jgi:(S)-2-hydroxyglutarate dehydrogenase
MDSYDVVVVGGGIVGLATARDLQQRRPRLQVAVVEKEAAVGSHQTARNSGVLHAGIYYQPGSLKALLCREGKEAVERFADHHGIPVDTCGKLVVAVHPSELPGLDELHRRGTANGVPGLRLVGPEEMRDIEPHVTGVRALLSPSTGIVDFALVARALAEEVRSRDGVVHLGTEVNGLRQRDGGWLLETSRGALKARMVVACAGLHSDRVARMTGDAGDERIIPFRGRYLRLRPAARHLVRNLIYPVPDPRLPFLGVHFTRRPDGDIWLGPNVGIALAREGYRRRTVRVRDVADMLRFPGLWRLLRRYPAYALRELWRDLSRRAFAADARRYVPDLRPDDLLAGPIGVRAQAVRRDGTLVHDFSLEGRDGLLHVRNAPSPAATASLAIGRVVAERILE